MTTDLSGDFGLGEEEFDWDVFVPDPDEAEIAAEAAALEDEDELDLDDSEFDWDAALRADSSPKMERTAEHEQGPPTTGSSTRCGAPSRSPSLKQKSNLSPNPSRSTRQRECSRPTRDLKRRYSLSRPSPKPTPSSERESGSRGVSSSRERSRSWKECRGGGRTRMPTWAPETVSAWLPEAIEPTPGDPGQEAGVEPEPEPEPEPERGAGAGIRACRGTDRGDGGGGRIRRGRRIEPDPASGDRCCGPRGRSAARRRRRGCGRREPGPGSDPDGPNPQEARTASPKPGLHGDRRAGVSRPRAHCCSRGRPCARHHPTTPTTAAGGAQAQATPPSSSSSDTARIQTATDALDSATTSATVGLSSLPTFPTPSNVEKVINPYMSSLQLYGTLLSGSTVPAPARSAASSAEAQVRQDLQFLDTIDALPPLTARCLPEAVRRRRRPAADDPQCARTKPASRHILRLRRRSRPRVIGQGTFKGTFPPVRRVPYCANRPH